MAGIARTLGNMAYNVATSPLALAKVAINNPKTTVAVLTGLAAAGAAAYYNQDKISEFAQPYVKLAGEYGTQAYNAGHDALAHLGLAEPRYIPSWTNFGIFPWS